MPRRKKIEKGAEEAISGIEKYVTYQKAAGVILILIGIFLILNSLSGITGFIIVEQIRKIPSSIIGLIFIVGGVLLFLRGRDSLRRHNEEARYAMKQLYKENYGRLPTKKEQKEYIRKEHERGLLSEIVEQFKLKRK